MDEELQEYINSLSEPEKMVILITGHTSNIKSTRLQKLSLIVKALIDGKIPRGYNAYLFGGYSDDIAESAENMRDEGFMKYESGIGYILSDDGKEIFKMISSEDKKMEDIVKKVSDMFNGISDEKVTAITYKLFPDLTKKSIIKDKMDKIGGEIDLNKFDL